MKMRSNHRVLVLAAIVAELSTGCSSPANIKAAEILVEECAEQYGINSPSCRPYLRQLSALQKEADYWSELGRGALENLETDGAPAD